MSSIDYLIKSAPMWVEQIQHTKGTLSFRAYSPRKSGSRGRLYDLVITLTDKGFISVSESPETRKLPKCCIERHINSDSSLCVYLNSHESLIDIDHAKRWWHGLGEYLNSQDYAEKFKIWPRDKGLSHGDAAQIQLEMEEVAEALGWKTEILDSIFRNKGWLSGTLMRYRKDKKGFANLRSPCPRGCKKLHFPNRKKACTQNTCKESCSKMHFPILRRSCPHREAIEKLTELETKRRALEGVLIDGLKQEGFVCCGTIKLCPLKTESN